MLIIFDLKQLHTSLSYFGIKQKTEHYGKLIIIHKIAYHSSIKYYAQN